MKAHHDENLEVGGTFWLDPDENPPPRGCKVFLLTRGQIAVIGQWSDDCIGWHPLLKIPHSIKSKLWPEDTEDGLRRLTAVVTNGNTGDHYGNPISDHQ